MCGIVGVLTSNTEPSALRQTLLRMISTLPHRGPDGWGYYVTPKIALGHTRLSIVDIAGGSQPMTTERYCISYNGEIYNHIELRKELQSAGLKFQTHSDTEVILKAFEVYGPDCLKKFNGQFAFLIWDRQEKQLTIARDRYGIRPLYILHHNGVFYYSSEMKAFDTITGFQRTFNHQALFEHSLLWNTLDDTTVFNDIRSLPAGTYEVYRPGSEPRLFRYYEIGESAGSSPTDINTAMEEFQGLLNDAVRLRLRSDVPVGAYLSGGIDSAVITYLTAKNNSEKFKTFSVAFEDKDFDESFYQREMAAILNTDHNELSISYDNINDHLLDTVYHTERPIFRTAPVPLYLLSNEVHNNGIKVVLTGEGADEVLFGYDSFKEIKLLNFWSKRPNSSLRPQLIKRLYPHLAHFNNPRQYGLMRVYYEGFLNNFRNELSGLNIRLSNNKILLNFLNRDIPITFEKEFYLDRIKRIIPDNFYTWSPLQQNQFLEIKTLLSGYLLSSQGDRMSLSHSVEGRYPFLDHRLVETLFYYNDNFKLNGFSQKYLLSKSFKKTVPESILNRPKRPYMSPDLKSFFKNGYLRDQPAHFLSTKQIEADGIFENKYVSRLIKKFEKRMPKDIGYRDNMLITFILTCQMVAYWIKNPRLYHLDEGLCSVSIIENS